MCDASCCRNKLVQDGRLGSPFPAFSFFISILGFITWLRHSRASSTLHVARGGAACGAGHNAGAVQEEATLTSREWGCVLPLANACVHARVYVYANVRLYARVRNDFVMQRARKNHS